MKVKTLYLQFDNNGVGKAHLGIEDIRKTLNHSILELKNLNLSFENT